MYLFCAINHVIIILVLVSLQFYFCSAVTIPFGQGATSFNATTEHPCIDVPEKNCSSFTAKLLLIVCNISEFRESFCPVSCGLCSTTSSARTTKPTTTSTTTTTADTTTATTRSILLSSLKTPITKLTTLSAATTTPIAIITPTATSASTTTTIQPTTSLLPSTNIKTINISSTNNPTTTTKTIPTTITPVSGPTTRGSTEATTTRPATTDRKIKPIAESTSTQSVSTLSITTPTTTLGEANVASTVATTLVTSTLERTSLETATTGVISTIESTTETSTTSTGSAEATTTRPATTDRKIKPIEGDEGFYNIAHMVNTKALVDWALGLGANGVEIDLAFNGSTGKLQRFRHNAPGGACDCSCLCPALIWSLCGTLYQNSVCAKLPNDTSSGSPCIAESRIKRLLNHLATKTRLAVIVIDSKVDANGMSISAMRKAGKATVKALKRHLFRANYGGKVIIGSPKLDTLPYLQAAVEEANKSSFKSRIYFTIDMEKNNIVETLETLLTLPTKNIIYGTGISACASEFSINESTLKLALLNKAKGVVGLSYSWTIDKESSMMFDLQYVQGMLTNYPGRLYDILMAAGINLATPSSTIPKSTSYMVTTSSAQCDCDYHPGGCSISQAPPANTACKCKYMGVWTCSGKVTSCKDESSAFCKTPDTSINSCTLGGGDCDGYTTAKCDCKYQPGGCSIRQTPPNNTACKCRYMGGWTCSGEVTRCKDESSIYCKTPDTSINTCILGGGDCEGYTTAKCDCMYHPGGCSISQTSPPNTACKCIYKGAWTCSGEVVRCLNFSSRYCKMPDHSVQSCFQGKGECEGYKNATCDCSYHSGGCIISRVPPRDTACKCTFKVFWMCGGDITRCRDVNNYYCKNPDLSRNTCLVGGGDCGGY